MKRYYTSLLMAVLSLNVLAITYTSTQNGNWMNPTTWSPLGVPLSNDNIIINHNVALDTSMVLLSGSITVNASGSLIQNSPVRDIWLNGPNASFTNNGTVTIRKMLLSAGNFTNANNFNVKTVANHITLNNTVAGVFNGIDSLVNYGTLNNNGVINIMTFYNDSTINNYGTIKGLTTVVDSMWNEGTFLNAVGAILKADSATNNGSFTNNGRIEYFQFTNFVNGVFTNNDSLSFDDFTNFGDFTNAGLMVGANSMWNSEDFDNTSAGQISLATSFLNADTVSNTATFNNNGGFNIGDSFFNFNDITGGSTGSFTVQDSSVNYTSGVMSGSFDFCDATPPATPIKIDFNLGTVDPNITYCVSTNLDQVSEGSIISVYPNPTNGILNIELEGYFTTDVYNVLGDKILTKVESNLDLSSYQNGVYFVLVKDKSGKLLKYEKVIKN
jgi:hypothetical protein